MAVGSYINNKTGTYRPLAERLDGSAWSVVHDTLFLPLAGAPTPFFSSEFSDVDCPATTTGVRSSVMSATTTLSRGVFAYEA